jgi:hypothetical protein
LALSDRAGRLVIGALIAALAAAALAIDLPRTSGGHFWSDGATYHAMAWSLAEDFDLRYEAKDVFRVRREFPLGPQGIFLKRTGGGIHLDPASGFPWLRWDSENPRPIFFAKAFAYPLAAAPLVRLFGTRGLLLTNVIALGLALWLGYGELRRRSSPAAAVAVVVALFGLTVAPVYVLWLTPEIFNLGLIAAGLAAWRRDRPFLSALLLGIATYSKPYNLFLALPLGVAPFLPLFRRDPAARFLPALRGSVLRGAVLAGTVVLLFGANKAVTGELNYQGGERKTFYGTFPFEVEASTGKVVTFGNSGIWMTTDHLGALVEGQDEDKASSRTGPLRKPEEMRASFLRNLGYFWVGRFAGALAYFLPALVAAVLFVALGPRDAEGGLALAALLVSYLFYIYQIPDNWYGGGGTIGNRYFLNLLPLAVFFVPPRREGLVVGSGVLGTALFLFPILTSPVAHALRPGDHATRGAYRALPPELTMLNDLSVFTEPWRKKQAYGFMGDPHRHWPADPAAYFLYFTDDGTYGREDRDGEPGFWLKGGQPAEVILRALDLARVHGVVVRVSGGPAGDSVRVSLGSESHVLEVGPGEPREVRLSPGPGFPYYDTYLYVLRFRSTRGAAAPERPGSPLGAFVRIRLEVGP